MGELPLNQILCGDCVDVLKTFPENSIDLVVTDPPYGLKFMGKDWDKTLPPRDAFYEMHRVLKPGAMSFVMSSPRQDLMARMILLLEDSGFKTDISFIDYIYKTGFPKALDVSKGIDKKLGLEREEVGTIQWNDGSTRKLLPKKATVDYGGRFKHSSYGLPITAPSSEDAKLWDGWKSVSGLKPAHEPVLMVYKPRSEKTIVDNVLKWGVGAINVDACRIPFQDEGYSYKAPKGSLFDGEIYGKGDEKGFLNEPYESHQKGRFPANLLVSDKAIDTEEITQSKGHTPRRGDTDGLYEGGFGVIDREEQHFDDVGGASRYFDLDAWAEHHGFLDVPKPGKAERDYGLGQRFRKQVPKSKFNLSDGSKDMRFDGVIPTPRRNTHPTVKPIKLMAYLIELGCPPDGVVLDPFVGSGTTCIAAKQLARRYIGVEIDEEYCRIAEARIAAYPQPLEWFEDAQLSEES